MPEFLDLASRPVGGAYFLTRRATDPPDFIPRATDGSYRHCFTYWKSDRTIRRELEDMITNARRKIFIASFLIGDTALLDALKAAADRLLGGVYVITQLDEKRLRRGLAELGDNSDAAVQTQKKRFDEMTRNGIYVRGHPDCHAKFVIVDDEVALVSSANLMTDALDKTGEDGVVVTDADQVRRLAMLFARLWHTGCNYEAKPGQAYTLSKLKTGTDWKVPVTAPDIDTVPGIIWTDGNEHHILKTVHHVLGLAQKELLMATFSLKSLHEDPETVLMPIRTTVERGVRVRLLIRPRRDRADHLADAAALAEAGVEVYGDSLTHVKAVIADGRHGALFSANLDLDHGLTSGVEAGCRLDGTLALAEATRYLEHALDNAMLRYAIRPTHRELDESLDARWRKRWPLGPRITIEATTSHRDRFTQAAENGPVLFSIDPANQIQLHAGRQNWFLLRQNIDIYYITPTSGNTTATDHTLSRWLTQPPGGPPRGICATTIKWAEPDKE